MANAYTQQNLHVIFAVGKRENLILPHFAPELYAYMAGVIKNLGNYSLAVNGHYDHVHLFFELNPDFGLSEIVGKVKANSSRWMNEKKFLPGVFRWQKGYGGFSYSRSQRDRVIKYILNQEKHHGKMNFRTEYIGLLKKFQIEFKDQYLFEFFD